MSRRQARHVRAATSDTRPKDWFANKKRAQRRKMAVSLRWKITNDPDGAGVFSCHQYIPSTPSWNATFGAQASSRSSTHWADILFLSARPIRHGVFYNATIQTLADKVANELDDEAFEAVDALLSKSERASAFNFSFTKSSTGSKFNSSHPTFEALDGLTHYGAQARWLRAQLPLLAQRPVYVSCTILPKYCYGVGLDMVSDSLGLSVQSIVHDIERFRQMGEESFRLPTDITPHLAAIRAMVLFNVQSLERMDARARNLPEPVYNDELDAEALKHFHGNAVPLKV